MTTARMVWCLVVAVSLPFFARTEAAGNASANLDSPTLSEVEFNGLLARNASWGYLTYLVGTRPLTFTPAPDLLQQIEAAGGARLVTALKGAKLAPQDAQNKTNQDLAQALGRCAAFFEKDDYSSASKECSVAAKIQDTSPWPLMGLAAIAIQQEKYADAILLAHQAIALAPMMAEAHFSLGEAFALSGQGDSAVDELKVCLQLNPAHVDALVMLGDVYLPSNKSDTKNSEIALTYYLQAVALIPDFPDVHERLASFYEDRDENAAAADEYAALEKLQPDQDEWPRKEGKLFDTLKDYPKAIAAWGRVLALNSKDADARYERGYAMNELKNYSGAVEELREAQRLDPKNDRVFLSLGFALEHEGHYPEALGYFNETLELNPKECSAMLDIGWILDHEYKTSQALEEYNRAADCAGDNPLEIVNLGIELVDAGQLQKAVQVLERSVTIAPDNLPGHMELGVALLRLKQFGSAEAEFRKAASLDPENALAHDNLCQVLDNEREYVAAVQECEQMVQLDPHKYRGWDLLASELENVKNYDSLVESARAATSHDPQSAAAWEELAIVLRGAGDLTQALDGSLKAIALDPQNSFFHFELGQTYASLHDMAHEETEYHSAVTLVSDDASEVHALAVALFWKTTDREDARKLFQEIENDGEYRSESLIDLGAIASGEGNYKDAIEYENEALAMDPDSASARANLSICLLDENKVDEAVNEATRAIKTHPEFAYAHQALGYALAHEHKWPAAIAEFREAAKLEPTNISSQVILASVLSESGDLAGTKEAYELVLQKEPKDPEQWSSYGTMLMNMHDDADAEQALTKSVALDPRDPLALNNLAWFYATSFHPEFHNFAKALRLAKQANDLTDWKYAAYIDTYAAALDLAGKHAEAAIAEQQAVNLAPQDSSLQAALRKYQSEAAQAKPAAKNDR